MKSYNGNLEEISLPEDEKYLTDLMSNQIDFIEKIIGKDCTNLLTDRANGLAYVQFLSEQNNTYQVIYNGQKQILTNKTATAFNTFFKQSFDGNKWTLKNGLYLRGGLENNHNKQRLSHELFHNLSGNTSMGFDKNGIGYTKSGVQIVYYDRQDNIVDESLRAEGLNEGITEMLAMKYSNVKTPQQYDLQVSIAKMLNIEDDNLLLKAYFSDNDRIFKDFLNDFESRQSSVTQEDLVSMDISQIKDQSYIENMIRGCSEYSLSYCQSMEDLNIQKNKLYSILYEILDNPNIYTGKDNNKEVFEKTLNETISKREQELGIKTKDPDDKDIQGLGLQQDQSPKISNGENYTRVSRNSTSFKESIENKSISEKKGKINSASFKASLATKRKETRTGYQDIKKSKNIIALRKEKDRFPRDGKLSEKQSQKKNNGIIR